MSSVQIHTPDDIVIADVRPRRETYYVVTELHLRHLGGNSVFSDVFVLIASLMWGAYFSLWIALKLLPADSVALAAVPRVYQGVFFWAGLGFTVLAVLFLVLTHKDIGSIKRMCVDIED